MPLFTIHVTDAINGDAVPANIYLLDGPAGNGILVGGAPAAFQTDMSGMYAFTNVQPQVYVRVESSTYNSQNVTLVPGNNQIAMSGISGPEVTIQASRTFWNKHKTIILLLLVLLALVVAVKYKLIAL